MKKIASLAVIAALASSAAFAQSTTVDGEPLETSVMPDVTFDLDRTDSATVYLPADAGDYDVASPSEVQTITSITFDL